MRLIRCCGQDNRSPFCAMCGRRLQTFPLSDLLNHCREQAEKHEKKLQALAEKYGTRALGPLEAGVRAAIERLPPTTGLQQQRPVSSTIRADIDKVVAATTEWRSYAAALEGLMRHVASLPADQVGGETDGHGHAAPITSASVQEGRNLDL